VIEMEFKPTVLLRSADTRSELSVVEGAVPPHWPGPPLHHHAFDETFYVIEGELTFQVRDEIVTAGPGTLMFAERNVPHTFANLGEEPARYLLVLTPGGFERYFDRLSAEAEGTEPPEGYGPRWDVTRVGPQIGARE
jgi:mannose-6-phosphate isomerase-like protein (cupin superfamily)